MNPFVIWTPVSSFGNVVNGKSLRSTGKIGSEPVERCNTNSIQVLKSLRENAVASGVERIKQQRKKTKGTQTNKTKQKHGAICLICIVSSCC